MDRSTSKFFTSLDALTQREQDIENQFAAKVALQTQTLLGLEHLDLQVQMELKMDLGAEICPIDCNKHG